MTTPGGDGYDTTGKSALSGFGGSGDDAGFDTEVGGANPDQGLRLTNGPLIEPGPGAFSDGGNGYVDPPGGGAADQGLSMADVLGHMTGSPDHNNAPAALLPHESGD